MTNIEYIRQLDTRALAELLLQKTYQEDIDYDWEEDPYLSGITEFYRTSDGKEFWEEDREDAIAHEMEWLMWEYEEKEKEENSDEQ